MSVSSARDECCGRRVSGVGRTGLDVEDHLHGLLPERDHAVEPGEVEVVLDEILGDLAKVFVSGQRAEPADPRQC